MLRADAFVIAAPRHRTTTSSVFSQHSTQFPVRSSNGGTETGPRARPSRRPEAPKEIRTYAKRQNSQFQTSSSHGRVAGRGSLLRRDRRAAGSKSSAGAASTEPEATATPHAHSLRRVRPRHQPGRRGPPRRPRRVVLELPRAAARPGILLTFESLPHGGGPEDCRSGPQG